MSSIDLFFLIATLAVVFITLFLCWALFYCISILRKINNAIDEVQNGFQTVLDFIKDFGERISSMKSILSLVGQSAHTLIELSQKHLQSTIRKKTKKQKEDEE